MRQLTVLATAFVAIALANAPPARAQATTTFVSGFGFDTNPCTVAAPCRSFQRAHDQTTAGGQITMLDAAGYGAVFITKSISIVNDGGGEAGITAPGFNNIAIVIAVGASDVVNLRGLTLNGVGTGNVGILFDGGTLNIQNCVIRDFGTNGIGVKFQPSASAAITIADTIVSNNSAGGIFIAPQVGTTSVHLERVAAIGNRVEGLVATAPGGMSTVQGVIVDSVAIGNGGQGFFISPGSGGAVTLINSKAIQNGTGLQVSSPGTTYISGMTVVGNTTNGFQILSGTLQTFGDNYIIDTNNSGTLTPIAEQ